jgi:hypothetical protein
VVKSRTGRTILLLCLILVMLVPSMGTADSGQTSSGKSKEAQPAKVNLASAVQGKDYRLLKESSVLQVFVNGEGNLSVKDKRNGRLWQSTPSSEELSKETVKGLWKQNLDSPFYLEYIDVTKGETKLKYGNFQNLKAKANIKATDQGVEITYDLEQIKSSLTYIVTLQEDHIEVSIPTDRIREGNNIRIVDVWLLPFLGAALSTSPNGHMFVPDEMGATIPFEKNSSYPFRYTAEVYGSDLAVSQQMQQYSRGRSSEALLPVFGISYDGGALLGIITEGDFNANIQATPSGLYTKFNWICPQFVYRKQYFKQTSSFGEGFDVFEKEMNKQDRRVRYYFLEGEEKDVNYVGMAAAYRKYLMEEKDMKRIEPKTDHIPLDLYLFGGDREPGIFGTSLVVTTTFDQAREIFNTLESAGVGDQDVTYLGWESGGYMRSLPARFPPEKRLGGEAGLSRLIEDVHRLGSRIYLDDNYVVAYSGGSFKARTDALRDSNKRVIEESMGSQGFSFIRTKKKYWMQPALSLKYLIGDLPKYGELGIDGISHNVIGDYIHSDNNPSKPSTRENTMDVYRQILNRTMAKLGSARVTHGNAYVLGLADHISMLPLSSSYDMLARNSVPFYPIAIHGLVSYSAEPGNLQDESRNGFLKSIEYGAAPAYLLTYKDSSLLKDSFTKWIYSSQYREWLNTVVKEYQLMDEALGDVRNRFIVNHRQLAPGVYETSYDSGKRIVVNYNATAYSLDGINVKPYDFTVL